MSVIKTNNLQKHYQVGENSVHAVDGVDLNVREGEFVCISGRSGSGKSTLLSLLAGLESPTDGEVVLLGEHLEQMNERERGRFRREHIGFIFQAYNLLPNLTATENVALPLMFRGMPQEQREAIARKMLCRVGLAHRLDHFPSQMSGGQQQRAGIARAFITRPDIVFADEPTGNLDSATTAEIMEMIRGFARKFRQTIILVTHDPEMAAYADRVVKLIDGEIVSDERTPHSQTSPNPQTAR